jgi:hypothetical protein
MARIYMIIGALVLSAYSWAQYQGIGLFDDTAVATHSRSSGTRSTFHK